MKKFRDLALFPAGIPLSADEIMEFHLARILLLLKLCGRKNRITGLTKFAKLDFFARYPEYFNEVANLIESSNRNTSHGAALSSTIESSMVRHHYGPWDKRYYHLLARLSATDLISVGKSGSAYTIELTQEGQKYAKRICEEESYSSLTSHMRQVSKVLGGKNGNTLKKLIYETFEHEVALKSLGEDIR